MDFWILYAISAGTIFLGFIALLSQKVYIDKDTKEASEVEIPFLGKMKSNYPAMVIVFLGVALAAWVFNKDVALKQSTPRKVEWKITGLLKTTEGSNVDWRAGTISLFPTELDYKIENNGRYTITAQIDEGKNFSDVIQAIDYSYKDMSLQINTQDEYEKYKQKKDSLIASTGPSFWSYKPLTLTPGSFGAGESVK